MNLRVPLNLGNYWTSRMAMRVLTKTLPHKLSIPVGGGGFNDNKITRHLPRGTEENKKNLSKGNDVTADARTEHFSQTNLLCYLHIILFSVQLMCNNNNYYYSWSLALLEKSPASHYFTEFCGN
jgi:hypothetical protein